MYKMTEEHKRKIGNANKRGLFLRCLHCKEKFWAQPHRIKTQYPQQYCNRDCFKKHYKENFSKVGVKNRFWKGGSFVYWKREVLKRDNFTCRICGIRDPEIMEVDHILEKYKGGKNFPENLQTICPNCHRRKTNSFLKNKKFLVK